jgi:hypothetical protein
MAMQRKLSVFRQPPATGQQPTQCGCDTAQIHLIGSDLEKLDMDRQSIWPPTSCPTEDCITGAQIGYQWPQ